jgi:competence ComEA-like helix-hairpin-helix protein
MSNFSTPTPAAQFAGPHSYQINGDWLHLQSGVQVLDAQQVAAHQWAIQLWACEPTNTSAPQYGTKMAQVVLDSQGLVGTCTISSSNFAVLPAGQSDHALVLTLVSAPQGADFDTLHDSVVLSTCTQFFQPRLEGELSFTITGDQTATLDVAAIVNPRSADNLSGTLALEVWSLTSAYQDNQWHGTPVGSLVLGQLNGLCGWYHNSYQINIAHPGQDGYLTLMLREWTANGYLTRDYRTLTTPAITAAAPAETAPVALAAAAPEAEVEPLSTEATAATTEPSIPAEADITETTEVAAEPAPAELVIPAEEEAEEEEAEEEEAEEEEAEEEEAEEEEAEEEEAEEEEADGRVSVNRASEDELISINGIGPAMASRIIASRPYAELEDLRQVKGMGATFFNKILSQIKL